MATCRNLFGNATGDNWQSKPDLTRTETRLDN
jgi:hypothetical protein